MRSFAGDRSRTVRIGVGLAVLSWAVCARAQVGPRTVDLSQDAGDVVVGHSYTCLRTVAGNVWCWGDFDGRRVEGSDAWPPALVALPAAVRSVAVGGSTACACTVAHEIWCWGKHNSYAHPLDGPLEATPWRVDAPPCESVAGGGSNYFCLVASDGTVACWGRPAWGPPLFSWEWEELVRQYGPPMYRPDSQGVFGHQGWGPAAGTAEYRSLVARYGPLPPRWLDVATPVRGLADITKIQIGGETACAVDTLARAYCWNGSNTSGELSDGERRGDVVAVPETHVTGFATVGMRVCAMYTTTAGAAIDCWGFDAAEDCDARCHVIDEAPLCPHPTPVPVTTFNTAATAHGRYVMGRTGRLIAWESPGPRCPNRVPAVLTPASPPPPTEDVLTFDDDGNDGCAIQRGGLVRCWGGPLHESDRMPADPRGDESLGRAPGVPLLQLDDRGEPRPAPRTPHVATPLRFQMTVTRRDDGQGWVNGYFCPFVAQIPGSGSDIIVQCQGSDARLAGRTDGQGVALLQFDGLVPWDHYGVRETLSCEATYSDYPLARWSGQLTTPREHGRSRSRRAPH